MQKGPVTPKGFGDVMPREAKSRRLMINAIVPVLEKYGFSPLETPTVEFAGTLLGKYGEEEKLIYQFEDKGGRSLALRYDLTVPLARFVANNLGLLQPTFSRYQIGQVFRGENPQKGRRREFTQFDFDTVGSADYTEDVKLISAIIESARAIGLTDAIVQINDRELFDTAGFSKEAIIAIDKIDKIGRGGVVALLKEIDIGSAEAMFASLEKAGKTAKLKNIFTGLEKAGFIEGKDYAFNPFLARGLNYYTSTIFELKLDKTPGGLSVGGGGRYDNLIGMFAGRDIPAVGFAFGFDRLIEAMDELKLFDGKDLGGTKILVTNVNPKTSEIADELRKKGINTELYVDEKDLDKQLRYADRCGIPYVLIVDGKLTLKNMKSGEQSEVTLDQLPDVIR